MLRIHTEPKEVGVEPSPSSPKPFLFHPYKHLGCCSVSSVHPWELTAHSTAQDQVCEQQAWLCYDEFSQL